MSSIKHYLTDTNGYVWDTKGVVSFTEVLQKAVMANTNDLKEKSLKVQQLATLFTFANYYRKLRTLVFKESV